MLCSFGQAPLGRNMLQQDPTMLHDVAWNVASVWSKTEITQEKYPVLVELHARFYSPLAVQSSIDAKAHGICQLSLKQTHTQREERRCNGDCLEFQFVPVR